jgi:hypothetical protein
LGRRKTPILDDEKKISDAGEITAREARGKAKEILGAIAKGIRPGETQRRTEPSLTLQSAWERYRKAHLVRKNRSQNTIDNYENDLRLHLKDWLNMPLEQLGKVAQDGHEASRFSDRQPWPGRRQRRHANLTRYIQSRGQV